MSLHEPVSAAEGVPFWTPKQILKPGQARVPQPEEKKIPKLFQPLQIRGLKIQNRIGLSPMCQYSSINFEATPWHVVHYGEIVKRGTGLPIIESTSVSAEGGISPQDLGIFNDDLALKLKPVVDFAHSQNQILGVQLNHAGRKASLAPNYEHLEDFANRSAGGWPDSIYSASSVPYRLGGKLPIPKELTISQIKRIVKEFGMAAKRSREIAGFDIVQIHAAHGYLINQFLSKVSNKRTDEYGGSFENRIRFLLEIIDEVRANVPDDYPVGLRISATDNSPDNAESWKIEDSVKLAPLVVARGVDIIDVSSGGNDSSGHARGPKVGLHVEYAKAVKRAVGDSALVSCVGVLKNATFANELLEERAFDVAVFGRAFLKNPGLVTAFAEELDVRIENPRQLEWALHTDIPQIIDAITEAQKNAEALKI